LNGHIEEGIASTINTLINFTIPDIRDNNKTGLDKVLSHPVHHIIDAAKLKALGFVFVGFGDAFVSERLHHLLDSC
jgi:hypothetical protein